MMNLKLSEFCEKHMDGLYDSKISEENQSSGYKLLKEMVESNIEPVSTREIDRWEKSPTLQELFSPPDIKYMRFLHPILRLYVLNNWDMIKSLKTK